VQEPVLLSDILISLWTQAV